jgi:hypothetical protein
LQADRHLRGAAAEGDDGHADYHWSHKQARGQTHSSAHHQFGAEDQQDQAAEQLDHVDQR